jgi:hypothetical protein
MEEFGSFFANEPERKHFAEYLTGLMIAHKKNFSAINREFAITTDQSCLNRWITEAEWDEEAFNRERLEWLQKSPDTRYAVHYQRSQQQDGGYGQNAPGDHGFSPVGFAPVGVFNCR